MGGQACILYGAAEFSRDVDLAVLADERNLARLRAALSELRATPVFVPPLSAEVLLRGHACHFRCEAKGTEGLRIDIMSSLHGCEPFDRLWARRQILWLKGAGRVSVLALADLVKAKKTQRDKDWPMIRRLLEADYQSRPPRPTRAQVTFWLREVRTPDVLLALCRRYRATASRVATVRPALRVALRGDSVGVERALRDEQEAARRADRRYWEPLRAELARWRRNRQTMISVLCCAIVVSMTACVRPEAPPSQRATAGATLFTGARLIVGDGTAIEDAAFLVQNHLIVQVGKAGAMQAPAGAVPVNLKGADFIVLDANPLDDIANTRRISQVYLRGEEVDRAALRAGWSR